MRENNPHSPACCVAELRDSLGQVCSMHFQSMLFSIYNRCAHNNSIVSRGTPAHSLGPDGLWTMSISDHRIFISPAFKIPKGISMKLWNPVRVLSKFLLPFSVMINIQSVLSQELRMIETIERLLIFSYRDVKSHTKKPVFISYPYFRLWNWPGLQDRTEQEGRWEGHQIQWCFS
jgi:hypothetical protein